MNNDEVMKLAENIQEDMQRHIEWMMEKNKKLSYEDCKTVYLIAEIAKLHLRINELKQ